MSKPPHNRIVKIVAVILLINFGLANLVLAQTTPSPTTVAKSLKRADLAAAQGNNDAATTPTACATFSKLVQDVTSGKLQAAWSKSTNRFKKDIYTCDLYASSVKVAPDGSVSIDELAKRDPAIKYMQISLDVGGQQFTGSVITKENWSAKEAEAQKVGANSASSTDLVGWVLNAVLSIVASAIGVLTTLAGGIMNSAIDGVLSQTETPQVVKIGWTVIRDLCNMLFILILIVIALAAILRLEGYDYKHLLGQLILMAILVNFSLVIAKTIMDAVNFVAAIFAPTGIKEIASAMFSMYRLDNFFGPGIDWKYGLTNGLGALIYEIVGLVVFLCLAALFVIRLVGLYVLMIFSPIAYVARILPATEKYSEEWWSHFVKYLLWAPVAMFMIKLTIIVANDKSFATQGAGDTALKFWILAAFMAAAVLVAKEAGMVGGEMVVHAVQGTATKAVKGIGGVAGGYTGRKWNEWTKRMQDGHGIIGSRIKSEALRNALFVAANPIAGFKGARERSKELSHMAESEAVAGGRQAMERAFTTEYRPWKKGFGKAKLKIDYTTFAARKHEDEFLKDYGNMKKESVMKAALEMKDMKGPEGEARKRAIVKAAASNGYLDDILRMREFAEKYGDADGTVYSAEILNRFLYDYLGNNDQAKRFMAEDMEELGKKTKHYEYLGHAFMNNKTGQFERGMEVEGEEEGLGGNKVQKLKNTWQAGYASSEFAKLGGRDRVQAAPHNFTVIRARTEVGADGKKHIIADENGEFSAEIGGRDGKNQLTFGRENGEIDEASRMMLSKMDVDTMREVQHTQERFKHWVMTEGRVVKNQDGKDTNGVIVVKAEMVSQLKEMYKLNPELMRGLYTKALGVPGDQWENLDGIRFVTEDQVEEKNGVTMLKVGVNESQAQKIGNPTFNVVDLKKSKSKSKPATDDTD